MDGDIPAMEEAAHLAQAPSVWRKRNFITPALHDPGFEHEDSLPDVAFGLECRQPCLLAKSGAEARASFEFLGRVRLAG
jgi:hypothetical protein